MVDSSPSPSSVPQIGATPAPKAGAASSRPHAGGHAHCSAHGPAAIEIFTSFHALVDAIAGDTVTPPMPKAASDAAGQAVPVASAPAGDESDRPASIVMPLDIAALLLPHTCGAKGLLGGAHQPGATTDGRFVQGSNGHSHDDELSRLLLGVRAAGFIDADSMLGEDAGDPNAVIGDAARQGLPLAADLSQGDNGPDGDPLARAVIQRLLAAAAAGPQKLAAELAGPAGSRIQNVVDDLLRHVAQPADRAAAPAIASAARFVSQHIGELTASSASSFAAQVTAAANPLLEPPSSAQLDQIVQAIRLQWSNGSGEAQIRLEPQHFGEMTVSLRVDQGQVIARVQADTPVIREWLQANQQALRQSLAEHNLTLSRLEVSEPGQSRQGTSRDGQHQHDAHEGRPSRRPRTPETGETFEVVA